MKNIYIISILLISSFLEAQVDESPEKIVDTTIYSQVDASQESINAQLEIDKLDEKSKKIYYEYKDTLAEYKGLKNYDDQLQQIVFSQEEEIVSLISQIDSLDETNKDILPFLKRMIDALREFIKLDIPFLYNQRMDKVNNLDDIILRSNVTTAEKFRKVFEAYQSEHSYGNTIETYDDIMMLNGQELSVSFFRLGRIGYYYKTLDGDQSGYWNKKNSKWVDMGSKLSNEIESAIDIANRQAPPNFITLPVSPLENK
tara:strand:+ start:156 stop:926 length:771 start_codon:yes stop_codon:yes gene_type:complete